MGRFSLAWRILTNRELSDRITALLRSGPAGPELPAPDAVNAGTAVTSSPKPVRSDAVTLLATLQREGRLIDFLKENIDSYSDAQVGAAVRDIHRECGSVLERQFAIRPVLNQAEGSPVSTSPGWSAARIRRTGRVDNPNAVGTLAHAGWMVTRCELPVWTGDAESAPVIAPAEVEMR